MLGFLYLILIIGWILIIAILKCKKTITPHYNTDDDHLSNYHGHFGHYDRSPSVNGIQIDSDSNYGRHPVTPYTIDGNIDQDFTTTTNNNNNDNNLGYTQDDFIINAPPPSYDDVMRQPEFYPTVGEHKTQHG